MGSLVVGPLGLLFGLPGLAVTTAVGAVGGAIQTARFLKKKAQDPGQQAGQGPARPPEPQVPSVGTLGAPVGLLSAISEKPQGLSSAT